MLDGPGELRVAQQELERPRAADAGAGHTPEHLSRRDRLEHGHPGDVGIGEGAVAQAVVQQDGGLHVDHPGGHVGPFEVAAQVQEGEGLVVAHHVVEQAGQGLALPDDGFQPLHAAAAWDGQLGVVVGPQVQPVGDLPA